MVIKFFMTISRFLKAYKKEKRKFPTFSLKPYFQFCKSLLKIKERIKRNYSIPNTCTKKLEKLDDYLKKENILAFVGGSYFFGCPTEESDIDCYILFSKRFSKEDDMEHLIYFLKERYKASIFVCISEINIKYHLSEIYLLKFITNVVGDRSLYKKILSNGNFSFFRFEKEENLVLPIHKDVFWLYKTPERIFLDVLKKSFSKYLTRIHNEKEKNNLSKIINYWYKSWLNTLEKNKRVN